MGIRNIWRRLFSPTPHSALSEGTKQIRTAKEEWVQARREEREAVDRRLQYVEAESQRERDQIREFRSRHDHR